MPLREAVKQLSRQDQKNSSDSAASQVQQDLERPTAHQIYAQVAKNAHRPGSARSTSTHSRLSRWTIMSCWTCR